MNLPDGYEAPRHCPETERELEWRILTHCALLARDDCSYRDRRLHLQCIGKLKKALRLVRENSRIARLHC